MIEDRLSTLALDAVRRSIPLDSWDRFANFIAADRRNRQKSLEKSAPDSSWFPLLDSLRTDGFAKLPTTLSKETVAEIMSYMSTHLVHRGPHVFAFNPSTRPPSLTKTLDAARSEFSMAGYRSDQIICAPHVIDVFNDPRLIDFLEAYLGCVPTLYSLNAWWSFPASRPELIYSQYFHRDIDDWRFVTLFLYLTDVDESGGPHQVIRGSHTVDGMAALVEKAKAAGKNVSKFDVADSFVSTIGEQYSQEWEKLFGDMIFDVKGPAGTMHLVNTVALHRGLMPSKSPRLVMWARYGLGATCNSSDLEHGPLSKRIVPTFLSDSRRNRFVNRLLFDFDRGPEY